MALALAAIGCGGGGGVTCPAGEDCSGLPGGLFFSGAKLGDTETQLEAGLHPIAIGGTQTIHVWLDADADMPFEMPLTRYSEGQSASCESAGGQAPAFCAAISADSATDSPLEIVSLDPPSVTVRGLQVGSELLDITDPYNGSQDLFDRISLEVVPVASYRLMPPDDFLMGDPDLLDDPGAQVAYAVGSSPRLVVGLFADTDTGPQRIIDSSLDFVLPVEFADSDAQWDMFFFAGAPQSAGDYPIDFTYGTNSTGTVLVKVTDRVDNLIWVRSTFGEEPPSAIAAGESRTYCFRALRSDSGQYAVFGADWSFTSSEALQITGTAAANCATVNAITPGPGTLTVTADALPNAPGGDLSLNFGVTVTAPESP